MAAKLSCAVEGNFRKEAGLVLRSAGRVKTISADPLPLTKGFPQPGESGVVGSDDVAVQTQGGVDGDYWGLFES